MPCNGRSHRWAGKETTFSTVQETRELKHPNLGSTNVHPQTECKKGCGYIDSILVGYV